MKSFLYSFLKLDNNILQFYFSHFEKSSPQPEINAHLELSFNLRSVLFDFQSFTEKHFQQQRL